MKENVLSRADFDQYQACFRFKHRLIKQLLCKDEARYKNKFDTAKANLKSVQAQLRAALERSEKLINSHNTFEASEIKLTVEDSETAAND